MEQVEWGSLRGWLGLRQRKWLMGRGLGRSCGDAGYCGRAGCGGAPAKAPLKDPANTVPKQGSGMNPIRWQFATRVAGWPRGLCKAEYGWRAAAFFSSSAAIRRLASVRPRTLDFGPWTMALIMSTMIGTILNVAGIVVGGVAGLTRRKRLSAAHESFFKVALGVFAVFYGLRLTWLSLNGSFLQIPQAASNRRARVDGRQVDRATAASAETFQPPRPQRAGAHHRGDS